MAAVALPLGLPLVLSSGMMSERVRPAAQAPVQAPDAQTKVAGTACRRCGTPTLAVFAWCPQCGTALRMHACTYCGQVVTAGEEACPHCGGPVGKR